MFVATVIALVLFYSRLLHCCSILNRTDFLREEKLLKKMLFEDYDPKLPVISTIVNSSETDGVNLPRFEITLALGYLKLMRMVESEQKVDFIFEYQMVSCNQ
ncbi:hypothetical protein OSTOST_07094 [Ostertagia ostertagi]